MVRTTKKPLQVYLRPDQLEALRAVSRRRHESLAALVRRAVDLLLKDIPAAEDPLQEVIALCDSGRGDLAQKHDEYMVRALQGENRGDA